MDPQLAGERRTPGRSGWRSAPASRANALVARLHMPVLLTRGTGRRARRDLRLGRGLRGAGGALARSGHGDTWALVVGPSAWPAKWLVAVGAVARILRLRARLKSFTSRGNCRRLPFRSLRARRTGQTSATSGHGFSRSSRSASCSRRTWRPSWRAAARPASNRCSAHIPGRADPAGPHARDVGHGCPGAAQDACTRGARQRIARARRPARRSTASPTKPWRAPCSRFDPSPPRSRARAAPPRRGRFGVTPGTPARSLEVSRVLLFQSLSVPCCARGGGSPLSSVRPGVGTPGTVAKRLRPGGRHDQRAGLRR